ncbi:preprotein translocase subunit SecF [Modicisalibacter muralis]|uniref:Protein-export membrane protein SecF n=1 Tax=Modicisalibacter muralis TaxID=119000 RepID=A0A1G9RYU6_9GAMM|nr:protein translocase subunit SecF [Halomonas muralis]SDM28342.1 preprotein translocase subunit SecF [Halomonas muralis]
MRQFDFMGKRRLAFFVSGALILISVAALLFQQLNLGLDFTGGTLVEVRYAAPVALDTIRQLLESAGYQNVSVQTFGATTDVLVRLQQAFDPAVGEQVIQALRQGGESVDLIRAEFVGSQVGDQLRDQSGLGMLVAMAGVALYVAIRFQYKFAIGALVALVHDVIIVLGVFSIFQLDFDLTALAAVLAVIGYSLNDTIIIFDRIRENIRKSRSEDMPMIFNEAINQTLARTLATSGTTLLVLLALLLLGGDTIHNFALALIIGVGIGTFSSIYVASALLLVIGFRREDMIPAPKENAEEDELP